VNGRPGSLVALDFVKRENELDYALESLNVQSPILGSVLQKHLKKYPKRSASQQLDPSKREPYTVCVLSPKNSNIIKQYNHRFVQQKDFFRCLL
jgi:hypothetical protein